MPTLSRAELWSLEEYSELRPAFRTQVLAHKKTRQVSLGEHARLYFEDVLTIRYQVQEMLRIEKIFEEAGIRDEIEAYNPLIPDGRNFKATMLIEYEDEGERRAALAKMKGIEDRVWVRVEGCAPVYAIADEDLERENDEKTSSVHFVRFELTHEMVAALKYGVGLAIGVDHPAYTAKLDPISPESRAALLKDLD
jgi:hypothetical protein